MKRLLLVVLSLAILLSCFSGIGLAQNAGSQTLSVLYIPMDDRPFNDARMQLMAQSLGIELIMPDESLYNTVLDGQTDEGCSSGDRAGLMDWLIENQDRAEIMILSLDQLLSGGLLNSRCMSQMTSITLSDGTAMTEQNIIDFIAELADIKTVYIIDSVQRLACSYGFADFTISDYYITRSYGLVERPVLTGDDLTIENIIASYRYAADGTEAYLHAGLTEQQLAYFLGEWNAEDTVSVYADAEWDYIQRVEPESGMMTQEVLMSGDLELIEESNSLLSIYLAVRERKLRLTTYALETLTALSNVHYLLGVDDSAEGEQIQSNEIRYFEQFMNEDDQMLSALDGLGQMALTKVYKEACGSDGANVSITYFGYCKDTVNDFNFKSNDENVDQLLSYYGCTKVTDNADIAVLIYCGDTEDALRSANLCKLVSQLNENEADGIPTVLVDVTGGEHSLMSELPMDSVHLGMLMAYSGRAEGPGQVHMAMTQGIARYFSLQDSLSQEAQIGHLENLLSALAEEIYDTSEISYNMYQYIDFLGQSDPMQYVTTSELKKIYTELKYQMKTYCVDMLESFSSSNFIVSLQPYTLAGITSAEINDVEYPWLRQFEIWCTLSCDYTETAHDTGELHRWAINGVSWTAFCPTDLLTREQATKILMLFTQEAISEELECPFDDVADWAEQYVAEAAARSYVFGCDDGTFQGSRNMTRAEFASLMVQYLDAEGIVLEATQEASFRDVKRSGAWYSEAVYLLADSGIIKGFTDGSFRPNAEITRVEAVALFVRLFGREEGLPDSLLALPRYADVQQDHWAYEEVQEASISHFCVND